MYTIVLGELANTNGQHEQHVCSRPDNLQVELESTTVRHMRLSNLLTCGIEMFSVDSPAFVWRIVHLARQKLTSLRP